MSETALWICFVVAIVALAARCVCQIGMIVCKSEDEREARRIAEQEKEPPHDA